MAATSELLNWLASKSTAGRQLNVAEPANLPRVLSCLFS